MVRIERTVRPSEIRMAARARALLQFGGLAEFKICRIHFQSHKYQEHGVRPMRPGYGAVQLNIER